MIAIGCDHGGYELKLEIIEIFRGKRSRSTKIWM